jgi:hypothetical protein
MLRLSRKEEKKHNNENKWKQDKRSQQTCLPGNMAEENGKIQKEMKE